MVLIQYICVFSTFLLWSCATPSELDKYSTREIDRPYTLSSGLNTWKTINTAVFDSTASQSFSGAGVFPFNWEQGLTDNLTLIWTPIPLQFRYQFYRNSTSFVGLYFSLLGPTYARGYDFNWSPTLNFAIRRKMSEYLAIEGTIIGEPEINRNNPLGASTYGVQWATWFQASDNWALAVKPHFLWEMGDPRSRYFGQLPPGRDGASRAVFPIYFDIEGMIFARWQVNVEYQLISLPASNQFLSHQFLNSIQYYF